MNPYSLGWLLNGAVLLEGQQFPLDALQRVGQVALLQLQRLLADPAQQVCGQTLVLHFLAIGIHQLADNLRGDRTKERKSWLNNFLGLGLDPTRIGNPNTNPNPIGGQSIVK